ARRGGRANHRGLTSYSRDHGSRHPTILETTIGQTISSPPTVSSREAGIPGFSSERPLCRLFATLGKRLELILISASSATGRFTSLVETLRSPVTPFPPPGGWFH